MTELSPPGRRVLQQLGGRDAGARPHQRRVPPSGYARGQGESWRTAAIPIEIPAAAVS